QAIPPPPASGIHARRTDRRRSNRDRSHGPRSRLGKSRSERNHLKRSRMNQESRKTGRLLRDSEITRQIIAVAIHVHRELGPGFLESIYEEALAVEFALSGIQFVRQYPVPLFYRDHQIGEHRLDFL